MSVSVATVHCEFDDWDFAPQFTDGVVVERPLSQRIDWFLVMLVVVVIASILMGVLVLRAYSQA